MRLTAEQIARSMGFPDDANGPYVTAFRALLREQVADGMTHRSGGTWASDEIWDDHEERARCFLEIDWDIKQGHSCRVELLDVAPIQWSFNIKTMRRVLRVRPKLIPAWFRDHYRRLAMQWQIWRTRNEVNPWREVK